MQHIVKRKGHTEPFDDHKIYASVYAACLSLRITDEEAESIAHMVTDEVKDEFKLTEQIPAKSIHEAVAKSLERFHPDAAYMYKTHKDLS